MFARASIRDLSEETDMMQNSLTRRQFSCLFIGRAGRRYDAIHCILLPQPSDTGLFSGNTKHYADAYKWHVDNQLQAQ